MPNQQHQTRRAIILMTCALAILICLDACAKYLGQAGVPVAASAWSRYVGHFIVVLILFYPRHGKRLFQAKRPALQWARGILMITITLLFFTALTHLPLAESTAIMFLTPILTTGLAAWRLHERPGRWSLVAIAMGFIGVLIVVRPGNVLSVIGLVLVMSAAVCNALYQTLTRASGSKTGDQPERVGTQLLYSGLVGAVLLTLAMPFAWSWDWLASASTITRMVFLLVGVLGAMGHLLLIRAFSLAPASALTPWMYLQLVWSVLIGWLVFHNVADSVTMAGMLLIGLAPQFTRFDRKINAFPSKDVV